MEKVCSKCHLVYKYDNAAEVPAGCTYCGGEFVEPVEPVEAEK